MASPIYRLASRFLREEWLQLFAVTATLQRCDLWEKCHSPHCHQLAFPIHWPITTASIASMPDAQHTAQEQIFLEKGGKKNPSIQLLCFQTWMCCLENLRLTERYLTTAWVQLRSETLGCISTVLANMRAHIQWGIKFLLRSCWTEIILNKPSKTDSDSSTAGIAQENFISARGKILPLYYCYRLHHLDLSSF